MVWEGCRLGLETLKIQKGKKAAYQQSWKVSWSSHSPRPASPTTPHSSDPSRISRRIQSMDTPDPISVVPKATAATERDERR